MDLPSHEPGVEKNAMLPSRHVVRVLIIKEGKICLGTKQDKVDGHTIYMFPGGGVEVHQSEVDAAINECLEEVGIAVTDIRDLGYRTTKPFKSFSKDRLGMFISTKTTYFCATYKEINTTRYGDDGDQMPYVWVTPNEAIELMKTSSFAEDDCEAIRRYKRMAQNLATFTDIPSYGNW